MKKTISILIITILTLMNGVWLYAGDTSHDEFYHQRDIHENLLRDYGLAYCVNTYVQDNILATDAGYASGVYFQKGWHIEPSYQNMRQFIQNKMSDSDIYYTNNQKANLFICLNIYHSQEYQEFIINQRYNAPNQHDYFDNEG